MPTKAKQLPSVSNTSGMTEDEIRNLTIIGTCENRWRARYVTVYAIPDSDTEVISVGVSFDKLHTTICREPRNGFSNAIAMFPKTYVYE